MGFNTVSLKMRSTMLLIILLSLNVEAYENDAEPSETDDTHSNKPRFLHVYSRPHPGAEKQMGVGFKQHLKNVFNGGTIGFHTEFRPVQGPVKSFFDHARKMIPDPEVFHDEKAKSFPGIFGGGNKEFPLPWKPEKDVPDKFPGKKDEVPDWKPEEYEHNHENIESEKPDWEMQDPKTPNADGSKFEDIGEDAVNYGEEVIQPRRPKRSADSHVYHVPIEFLSNAKPYLVKFRNNLRK